MELRRAHPSLAQQVEQTRPHEYGIAGRKLTFDIRQPFGLTEEPHDRFRQGGREEFTVGNQARKHTSPVVDPRTCGEQLRRLNTPDGQTLHIERAAVF